MTDTTPNTCPRFNRAAFLAGSVAALGAALPEHAFSATPSGATTSLVPTQRLLGQLMAGNKRFVNNDFPMQSRVAEKRELLKDSQAPYAAILGCSDSRVIPNLIFVQGIGDLFVARVAGNYPDDLVIASIEYAVEHLGTRLIMALGHQDCGAVKAVYSAIENKTPLPPHLSTIETLIAPGIASVVQARGTIKEAIEANVHAAKEKLRTSSPVLSKAESSGQVLITGGVYQLGTGEVKLIE
jgi:carbonic anhydrase